MNHPGLKDWFAALTWTAVLWTLVLLIAWLRLR